MGEKNQENKGMTENITALCYINGHMIIGPNGIEYNGHPAKAIIIRHGMPFTELEDKLYKVFKVDRSRCNMKIVYRYPQAVQQTVTKYEPVPVNEDEDIEIIFATLSRAPNLSGAELYLEVQPIEEREAHVDTKMREQYETTSRPKQRSVSPSAHDTNGDPLAEVATTNDNVVGGYTCEWLPSHINDNADITIDTNIGRFLGDEEERNDEEPGDDMGEASTLNDPLVSDMPMAEPPSTTFTQLDQSAVDALMSPRKVKQYGVLEKNMELYKGLRFIEKKELQKHVKKYSIMRHRQFKVIESSRKLWVVKCKNNDSGCNWMLRAVQRKKHNQFEITQCMGPHTCIPLVQSQDHCGLDSSLIAGEIQELVKEMPTITIEGIGAAIKRKFNYMPSYRKLWDAKQKAISLVFGDWDASYQLLPKWMRAVQDFNPGSWAKFIVNPNDIPNCSTFDRVFWAFAPSVEGFKHCRPVISIDATLLYGKYNEKIMIATAVDGNNHIFPLAFAIVDKESTDTWGWFLSCIRSNVTQRQGICLISDRHADINAAVANEHNGWQPPHAYHVYCLRHIASDFNKQFRDSKLKNMIMAAGMQCQVRKFDRDIQRLKQLEPKIVEWLNEISAQKWTLAYDGGRRYGMMTTNLSECFNGVLKSARFLPITALVQLTFFRLVSYFDVRQARAEDALKKNERFTPYAITTVMGRQSKASSHRVTMLDESTNVFQVQTALHGPDMLRGNNVHVVKLSERTCTCEKWQCYHLPCSHVMSVCSHTGHDYWQYVDECYTLENYMASYAHQFQQIPAAENWKESEIPTLYPDRTRLRKKGRPPTTRLRDEMDWKEHGNKPKCRLCREEGHDRRTCPGNRT